MIYQIGQVSNRDVQVLYFYRILRHSSTTLSELYRYSDPDVFELGVYTETEIDGEVWYEYHIDAHSPHGIPYLEFNSDDEPNLKNIEDLVEVEVTEAELILRGKSILNETTSVAVYWVPSLVYIEKLQQQIESTIGDLRNRAAADASAIDGISVSADYVMNIDGLVPNLVSIGKDEVGLIYDDSRYKLSGSLAPQLLVNPGQSVVSGLLKSQKGILEIRDNLGESKVYQGFYGGCMKLSGKFKTLVLSGITSVLLLTDIVADRIVISDCPAVMFRKDLAQAGQSGHVDNLEVRNSYLTIYQPITIEALWVYRMSTVVHRQGIVKNLGFIEAGSTVVYDEPGPQSEMQNLRTNPIQGLFYTRNPGEDNPQLEEIFLDHKPIAFQRGQVEDPVPISQATVNIYLKKHKGPSPSPSPSPSGKIYSEFTDWYWSGDSRTVQLVSQTGTDGKGYGGQSLPKLIEVQSEVETQGYQHNIILWWGVNGLDYGANAYADVYKDIADASGTNAMVFVGTVGHCPDGTGSGKVDGGYGQPLGPFNEQIEQFNAELKAALEGVENIHVLDVAKYIKDLEQEKGAAWLTNDNLHYTSVANQMIYDWVCQQITNVEPSDWEDKASTSANDIMLIYDSLRQSGFTKNAAIGAIANMKHETGSALQSHMIGYNSRYFVNWNVRPSDDLLTYMNTATSGTDLYNKIQATSTDGNLTGYGLTQFTSKENISALYLYHTETGLAYDRLGVQIPAFKKILVDFHYWDDANSQNTPGDAAYYLCRNYERPVGGDAAARERRVEANNLAQEYNFYD